MIEAILAVFAWRKGWRSLALVPVAVAVTFGVFCPMAGFPLSVALAGDVVWSAVLIVMIVRVPSNVREIQPFERPLAGVRNTVLSPH